MRRPSAALTISCLALVGAWGGPAVADSLITSRDVKDRSLTGRDIRSNSLTGRVVGNLTGRDVQTDSLDGTDVDEDALGTVPRARSATRADTAASAATAARADRAGAAETLDGARIVRVHLARTAGTEGEALDLGGLRIRGRCNTSNALTVVATTSGGPAWVRVSGSARTNQTESAVLVEDDDFAAGEEVNLLPGGADNVAGTIVYVSPGGSTVTVSFLAEQGVAAARGYACLFAGTAVLAAAG